jgi:hypothetical protein
MDLGNSAADLKMDPADLFREETFTDRKMGTIRRLTPVRVDGSTDVRRKVIYVGQAQLLTPVGAVPLTFEMDARSLEEALKEFAAAAKAAVDRTVEELNQLRRQAASSIVVPDVRQGGLGGAAGIPRGGKIKLP